MCPRGERCRSSTSGVPVVIVLDQAESGLDHVSWYNLLNGSVVQSAAGSVRSFSVLRCIVIPMVSIDVCYRVRRSAMCRVTASNNCCEKAWFG